MFQDSAGTTPAALGQPVGLIRDKSGNGMHLVQATTSLKPTLQQDAGGNYYLLRDGVDDTMASAGSASFDTPAFVIMGAKALGNNGVAAVSDLFGAFLNTSNRITIGTRSQAGTSYTQGGTARFAGGTTLAPETVNTVADYGKLYVVDGELTAAGYTVTANHQGGATTSVTTSGSISGPMSVPMSLPVGSFSTAFYSGVFIDRALTSTERANLRTYVGARTGVTY
jgi:hypothetical protein